MGPQGSRIRDSAAAVHETAATLGFTLKKEQEKVIVAFTHVFVALPTGFGKSLCYCRTFSRFHERIYCCGGESSDQVAH